MDKYRRIPLVVEAVRFNYVDGAGGPETRKLAESLGLRSRYAHPFPLWQMQTAEGNWATVHNGDYIITGVKGGKYPCTPDIFALTHEPLGAGDGEGLCEQRIQNLGNALRRILVEVGVFSAEAAPSGPELIMAVEEYIAAMRAREE